MSDRPETLSAQFAALHAERERSWPPAQLAQNIATRRTLVARFDPAAAVKVGDRLAPFTLLDVDGGAVTLDTLVADGPAVLIFFRFAGCPACNIALPHYDRQLWPQLAAAGVPLVAVSPQLPERLAAIRHRHGLGFRVASDPDNRLGRALGITFVPDDTPDTPPPGWIGDVTGTGTWELPQPAVLVIDRDRQVRFVAISPDWMDRAEAPDILAAVTALRLQDAA